jgi:hypothetical protein
LAFSWIGRAGEQAVRDRFGDRVRVQRR